MSISLRSIRVEPTQEKWAVTSQFGPGVGCIKNSMLFDGKVSRSVLARCTSMRGVNLGFVMYVYCSKCISYGLMLA
jgi:hypothetical protein